MHLDELIVSARVFRASSWLTRDDVLAAMLDQLVGEGRVPVESAPLVLQKLRAREELGSTGVGRGWAVPHAACPGLERPIALLAAIHGPPWYEFQAIDAEAVDLVILLLMPPADPLIRPREPIDLIRLIRRDDLGAALRASSSPAALLAAFRRAVSDENGSRWKDGAGDPRPIAPSSSP